MAKTINLIRIANAKLVSADIDKFGKTFAIQSPWNADGFSSVNVTVEQAPSDIKQYLEGDNSVTVYPVPSNVDKLCEYALASFPKIEDLYLFKNNGVVTIEDDLSYLENLKLIFVASDYISSYSSFTIITSGYQSFTSVDDYVGKVVNTNLINDKYTTFTSVDDYLNSYVVYNGVMTYVTNDNKNDLGIVAGTTVAYFGASAYKVTNDNKNSLYIVSGVTIAYDRYVTNIIEDYTLTIPFVGETTLTSEYVDSVIAMLSVGEKNAITKVIIPVDFTSYDSGSITAIQNAFSNLRYLETTYEAGAMELDLQGDVVAKIVSIGKTLDEALVYARTLPHIISVGNIETNKIIIIPPYKGRAYQSDTYKLAQCPNLVYVDDVEFTNVSSYFVKECYNCIKIKSVKFTGVQNIKSCFNNLTACKYLKIVFGDNIGVSNDYAILNGSNALEHLYLDNLKKTLLTIGNSTQYDRQALIDLINSLGTPTTQQTLGIGATNLSKLTQEDIDIATAKNWQLA